MGVWNSRCRGGDVGMAVAVNSVARKSRDAHGLALTEGWKCGIYRVWGGTVGEVADGWG